LFLIFFALNLHTKSISYLHSVITTLAYSEVYSLLPMSFILLGCFHDTH
jgi:hypothetical protein